MTSKRARAILVRTATGASLAGVLALVLWVTAVVDRSWPVLAIGAALALGLVVEFGRMGAWAGRRVTAPGLAALGVAIAALATADGRAFAYPLAFAVALVVAVAVRSRGALGVATAATWITVPLPALALVWDVYGQGGLVALVVLSKIGDVAGYYGGNAFGKHHPFPQLSPGKTTEGCVASFLAGCAAGPLCGALGLVDGAFGLPALVLAGAVVNLAAQAGDLLESRVKRRAGVKDSSTWLGASGGLLDVTDSLLVTVPVALATWPFLCSAVAR
ncbi:MAG: phosphatidate cytidylyltransferase [Planctomycetota bacterium]